MEKQSAFLDVFYLVILLSGSATLLAAIAVYVLHKLKIAGLKDFKAKHDYIVHHESKTMKMVWLLISIGAGLFVNLYGKGKSDLSTVDVWFFVRIFFGIAAGTVIGYVSFLIIEYYFPTIINKRLTKWRYMPRINPKTGKPMRLLTEDEEDVHLAEGMKAEENIFSIDYDVWVDDQTGDIKIEKYPGHLTALRCNNCTFHTMKVRWEEIIAHDESGNPSELLKHYKCSYCKNVRSTHFHISRNEMEDYKNQKHDFRGKPKGVEGVKVEVMGQDGKKTYEFQSPDQAQKFLDELDNGAKTE